MSSRTAPAVLAALVLATTPLIAAGPATTHMVVAHPSGNLAYRSYRPIADAGCAGGAMHVPAGKISHMANARDTRCAIAAAAAARDARLASAEARTARD